MCVLIFVETWNGKLKKSSFETIYYGSQIAEKYNLKTTALIFSNSNDNFDVLGKHGADHIINYPSKNLENITNKDLANIIVEIAKKNQAKHIIISNTNKVFMKIRISSKTMLI